MDVYEMNRDAFREALESVTTPLFIYDNAGDIYETMSLLFGQECYDSTLREWAFEWSSEGLGRPYDDLYDKWFTAS
jgi:hypothetical protein